MKFQTEASKLLLNYVLFGHNTLNLLNNQKSLFFVNVQLLHSSTAYENSKYSFVCAATAR